MTDVALTTWALASVRAATALAVLATVTGALPRWMALALGATLGLLVAALVPASTLPTSDAALLALAVREAAIGATLGLLAAAPLLAAGWAASLIDVAVGDGPGADHVARQAVWLITASVFVGLDGPARVARALVHSYQVAPLGETPGLQSAVDVVAMISGLAGAASQLALPLLLCAAVVEVALGAAARVSANVDGGTLRLPWRRVVMTVALAASMVTLALAITARLRAAWG